MPPVIPVVPVPPSDEQVGDDLNQARQSPQISHDSDASPAAQGHEGTAQNSQAEDSRPEHEAGSNDQTGESRAQDSLPRVVGSESEAGPDVRVASQDAIARAEAQAPNGGEGESATSRARLYGSAQIDHHYTPQTLRRIENLRRFGRGHLHQPPRAPNTDADQADSAAREPTTWSVAAINDRSDLYHIASILHNVLPAELVPRIMDDADQFERVAVSRKFNDDSIFAVQSHRSPQTVLETPPITTKVRRPHPVLEVRFDIEGHDQGFVSDADAGTWTWFVAWIRRPLQSGDQDQTTDEARSIEESSDAAVDYIHKTWLAENPQARREWTKQTIVWTADSEQQEHRDFVRALRPGDSIIVEACARFGGWVNYVRNIGITLTMPAVVR